MLTLPAQITITILCLFFLAGCATPYDGLGVSNMRHCITQSACRFPAVGNEQIDTTKQFGESVPFSDYVKIQFTTPVRTYQGVSAEAVYEHALSAANDIGLEIDRADHMQTKALLRMPSPEPRTFLAWTWTRDYYVYLGVNNSVRAPGVALLSLEIATVERTPLGNKEKQLKNDDVAESIASKLLVSLDQYVKRLGGTL